MNGRSGMRRACRDLRGKTRAGERRQTVRNILIIALYSTLLVFGHPFPAGADGKPSPGPPDQARDDAEALLASRRGMREALDFARSVPGPLPAAKSRAGGLLRRDEKMALWGAWSTLLDHYAALDVLGSYYKADFLRNDRTWQKRSFAIAYGSFLAEYRTALEFIALVDKDPALDTVLDEAVPEFGIPARTYGKFKLRFLNVLRATEFAALQAVSTARDDGEEFPGLRKAIDEDASVIWSMGKGKGYALTVKNALSVVGAAGFAAWFPVQKGAAEWMGDVKVLRQGVSLITADQIRALASRLRPGDILLERREWYLSNLGLPGFWTHAALYIGSPAERRAWLDDPAVHEWVRAQGIADGQIETLLRDRYPEAYAAGAASREGGPLPRVLEAVSEGVTFTTLEHSAAADSFAVLRPRLPKRDTAASLFRAFHYSGRPYDFNFDFRTDSSLVCSELIYKVYEPSPGVSGIVFPLDRIMGRDITTPNAMVRQFDAQYGTESQQTDMVLFLDGYEQSGKSLESGIAEFRRSWRRPKWHALVPEGPEGSGGKAAPSRKTGNAAPER